MLALGASSNSFGCRGQTNSWLRTFSSKSNFGWLICDSSFQLTLLPTVFYAWECFWSRTFLLLTKINRPWRNSQRLRKFQLPVQRTQMQFVRVTNLYFVAKGNAGLFGRWRFPFSSSDFLADWDVFRGECGGTFRLTSDLVSEGKGNRQRPTKCTRNGVHIFSWNSFQLIYLGNVDNEVVPNTPLLMHKR